MLRRRFRVLSFRNKLMISFLLVSLLPVLVVQVISYYVSTEAIKKKVDNLVQANLLQTSKNLDTTFQAYEDIMFQIFTNDDVIQLVKELNHPGAIDYELRKRKLINILSRFSYAKPGIRSVAIFTSSGELVCYDLQTGSPYENLWTNVDDLTQLPLYQEAMSKQSDNIITPPVKLVTFNNKEQYGFHLARKLIDLNGSNLQGIGVAVITVYESVLAQAINLNDANSTFAYSVDNRNYLTNLSDIIVSSPDKSVIGKNIRDVMESTAISNNYYNSKSNLKIYNLINQNQLFQEMYTMQRLSIFSGVAALLLSGALIISLSASLSSSIRKVVRAMKEAQQGKFNVQIEDQNLDEISSIAYSFNKMMNTVNELMTETKRAMEKQKEAEIRALEAQFNPHFLYNTLDSINWIAIEKGEHQISQMLKVLAQILRYSAKDSNKCVTVKEELEYVNRYVFLQQYRFRSSFKCEIEHDDEVLEFHIHKLLLQPFIENSIIHGFEGRKQGGLLRIAVHTVDSQTYSIRIEDNGVGMDETTVQAVLSGKGSVHKGRGSGLGIRNVLDRIHAYYGDKASCKISSIPGQGTCVELVLPIEMEGEKDE